MELSALETDIGESKVILLFLEVVDFEDGVLDDYGLPVLIATAPLTKTELKAK